MIAQVFKEDEPHMRRALELASRGLYTTDPNPRVGCVLVQADRVVGEGWHQRAGEAHAEVLALQAAGEAARGSTAYVTLEPCSHFGRTPPCADALIKAGVRRVVACSADPSPKVAGAGFERLRAAGVQVLGGFMDQAARELNPGFFSRLERGRPYVRLKMAMTLDARTAPADRTRRGISSAASREDVQRWRARSSAVLTGSGTVIADDPLLNVRLDYGPWIRQPLRVVLDSQLKTPSDARIYAGGGALLFAAGAGAVVRGSTSVERVASDARGLDLKAVLERLAGREVNELLVECGARLAGAFLEQDLVDEIVLYVAPHFLGQNAVPLAVFAAAGARAAEFEFRNAQRIGDDVRLMLCRAS